MPEHALQEEAVTFASGGVALSGTLTTPGPDGPSTAGGPYPAVMMLPGSGRTDRDDNVKIMAINLFPQLAAELSTLGFATFRYDKRGVGSSEGDYWTTGFDDRLTDASAAVAWLAGRPEVDPKRVFVLGHSEGAMIAVRLAAGGAGSGKTTVAGIVLLGGSAKTGEETMLWQGRQIAPTITGLNKFVIKLLRIDVVKSQVKNINRLKATTTDVTRIQGQKLNAKWVREFLAYDPAPDLAKVRVPVLAITGANDIQVDPDDLRLIAKLVPADVESHVVPDVTHLLRADPARAGLKDYRKQAKRPIDPRVVGYMTAWLTAHARG
jgi:pimeloyl-ACP methyl ester carboxylesterase